MNGVFARRVTLALLAIGILAAAGCGAGDDAGARRGGTVVISTGGDADFLFPPLHAQLQALVVTDLLYEKLADIGPDLNTVGDVGREPRLADRWVWAPDSMSVTFHLNPRARWHDNTPVRASDVRFAYNLYTDPKLQSSRGADIRAVVDSITVGDSLTCTAWFHDRTLERFHILTYNLKPLPEHILGSIPVESLPTSPVIRQPVGNGPFRLARWEPKQQIELAANDSFYRGRPSIDRVIWTMATDNLAVVQRVMTGEADFLERVGTDEINAAASNPNLKTIDVGAMSYGYIVFNLFDGESNRPHPIFGNRELRRALAMAVDRRSLVSNVFDSLGRISYGPFIRLHWSADTTITQIPFNRDAAAKILDSLGWKTGADGVREKNGRKLEFTVISPLSSLPRQRAAVVLQEQWRLVGVKLNAEVLEGGAWFGQTTSRKFDASMMVINADPSPNGVRQSWTQAGATLATGFNVGRYLNPTVDRAFEAAVTASNADSGRANYRIAYQTLVADAPAIWIFEPRVKVLASTRLNTGPLRADAWWMSIPSWTVSSDRTP